MICLLVNIDFFSEGVYQDLGPAENPNMHYMAVGKKFNTENAPSSILYSQNTF